MPKYVPTIMGEFRNMILTVPQEIYKCSGIIIFGKRIKSIVFSADVSIICNTNADAVIAVYPFTPQPVITRAIMTSANIPVFCGVGGGHTGGKRSVIMAIEAEQQGAIGVVLNSPTKNETIRDIKQNIDIPIVTTVVSDTDDYAARIEAGTTIFNVSAAAKTPQIVAKIRSLLPEFPIIATGGPTPESVTQTIEAGANAITWTPPTNGEIFSAVMEKYRKL